MIAKLHAKATAKSKAAAKSLRGRMSDAEAMLWAKLRDGRLDGLAFRRQHPVGRYVADFACPSAALLIEADGGQHCAAADSERDDNLRARGWKVLRFWNNDILQKTDEVLSAILQAAKEGANAKTLRRLSREQNQNHPPPHEAAKEGANAKTFRRLSREQNQNHPPPHESAKEGANAKTFRRLSREQNQNHPPPHEAAKEGANAKTFRRLSREQNQNHPPPLAGGGKNSRQRIFGGWRSDDDARCVATPRDRAVARSHPPPQAAGGKFLDFAARLRGIFAGIIQLKGKTVKKENQFALCGKAARTALLALAAAVASPALAEETNGWRVGAHGGTAGVGASAAWDFHDKLAVRAIANRFNYDRKETVSGKRYKGKLELANFGLLLDWHPFDNGFRVSGGAILNRNELSARATAAQLKLGDNNTAYGQGEVDADVDFRNFAPYLGVGYDGGRGKKGFSFFAEAGAMFQGKARLTGKGSVMADLGSNSYTCNFTISRNGQANISTTNCPNNADTRMARATLADNIREEHEKLNDKLKNFKVYPVVALGVIYRF